MTKIFILSVVFASFSYSINAQKNRFVDSLKYDLTNISIDNFESYKSFAILKKSNQIDSTTIALVDNKFMYLNDQAFKQIKTEQIASLQIITNSIKELRFNKLVIIILKK